MILLNEDQDKKLYQFDLETGKIVQELEIDGINTVEQITYEKKMDEFSENQVFLAMNKKNIFKLDPRVSGKNKMV